MNFVLNVAAVFFLCIVPIFRNVSSSRTGELLRQGGVQAARGGGWFHRTFNFNRHRFRRRDRRRRRWRGGRGGARSGDRRDEHGVRQCGARVGHECEPYCVSIQPAASSARGMYHVCTSSMRVPCAVCFFFGLSNFYFLFFAHIYIYLWNRS